MIGTYQLLTPDDCDEIVRRLRQLEWPPGQSPSEEYAAKVKRNKELPMGENDVADGIHQEIIRILLGEEFFTRRVIPKNLGRPRFNLSEDGGFYGRHADSAFMGTNPETRTDVSMTLFLTDPDEYEGGELVLEFPTGSTLKMKEPKGTIVFYPSGVMHQTTPVLTGQRICWVAWAESHIQDPQKRNILTEITELADRMEKADNLSEDHIRLMNIRHNLYRLWMNFG